MPQILARALPQALCAALLLAGATNASAQSTITPGAESVYGANIGWIDARAQTAPGETAGLQVGEFYCSGYLYSANVGWINCGNGAPTNGYAYGNDSETDFGLNTLEDGRLYGLAYGANIGWITFDAESATPPRYDVLTGKLSGYAYSANVGWINLGEDSAYIDATVQSLAPAPDDDADGLPDAWELMQGELASTEPLAGDSADADGDGQSDLQEYLAGTDPFDPEDKLKITLFQPQNSYTQAQLDFTSLPTRLYMVQTSTTLNIASWGDAGAGEFLGTPEQFETTALVAVDLNVPSRFWRVTSRRPLLPLAQ